MKGQRQPSAAVAPYLWVCCIAILVLTLGFGLWSATARITGAIIVPGKVEVERNRQVVQHPGGGVVAEILVEDGTFVEAGDVLLRLDTAGQSAELAFMEEQMFDVMARQDRLMAEATTADRINYRWSLKSQSADDHELQALLEGQTMLFEANMTSLEKQTVQLNQKRNQIDALTDGLSAQLAAFDVQHDLVRTALNAQESLLEKGLSQASELLGLRRELSSLNGKKGELRAALAEARERAAEVEVEILQRAAEMRGEATALLRDLEQPVRELRYRVLELKQRIEAANIRAPTSGIVYQLAVHTPRAVVRPAEPLMYLIPQDRPRVIAAHLQPQHIDQVRIGQKVKMRVSALNARTTPEVFGQITEVSADAIEDQVRGGHYFRVEVELSEGEIGKLPEGAVLLPGMPVETFIQTGDRSPMAYLLKPITDYLARAFRES